MHLILCSRRSASHDFSGYTISGVEHHRYNFGISFPEHANQSRLATTFARGDRSRYWSRQTTGR